MRTPQEVLEDLRTCRGPCWDICISCREAYHLGEFYEVLKSVVEENERLKKQLKGERNESV